MKKSLLEAKCVCTRQEHTEGVRNLGDARSLLFFVVFKYFVLYDHALIFMRNDVRFLLLCFFPAGLTDSSRSLLCLTFAAKRHDAPGKYDFFEHSLIVETTNWIRNQNNTLELVDFQRSV